ncbi:MAG: alpha-amylase [Methanomicrobiales archaeon]|nr:alpha-amylase [Methanomicrobiales archaeon]
MTKVCFGFEIHQPFRLNSQIDLDTARKQKNIQEIYFSRNNREIFERVAQKCYLPATQILLDNLDQGFHCALSLSGTVVEQLERWGKDALDLFAQVAYHKNAEILGQTYYHSLACLFQSLDEFEEQVRLHRALMKDMFGVEPRVFENTEFLFNNSIVSAVRKLGFSAMYTEGVDRILQWRNPNYLYTCQGLPLILRNCRLSDDIAFRFTNRDWDQYPLNADTYAQWIAATPGECVQVFIDYETFGEHQWAETGILEFFRWLPQEMLEKGNECITPTEATLVNPCEDLSIEETISWADVEKDTSAWLGNCWQNAAFRAIERARPLVKDRTLWRYLTTSDHFHYMASKFGSCEAVHSYFRQEKPAECFDTFMRVISDLEQRSASLIRERGAVLGLRTLSPEKAFHFHSEYGYTGYSSYSLDDFAEQLEVVPADSIAFHVQRGDFSRWVEEVIGDKNLARNLSDRTQRHELAEAVDKRRRYLWNRLK